MVLISGVKYACDICIRGHRVSACQHTEKPLILIKPKGRPSSQCKHCKDARRDNKVHTKCLCGSNSSASGCACSINASKCTCASRRVKKSRKKSRPETPSLLGSRSVSSTSLIHDKIPTHVHDLDLPEQYFHQKSSAHSLGGVEPIDVSFESQHYHLQAHNPLETIMSLGMPPTPEASESSPISDNNKQVGAADLLYQSISTASLSSASASSSSSSSSSSQTDMNKGDFKNVFVPFSFTTDNTSGSMRTIPNIPSAHSSSASVSSAASPHPRNALDPTALFGLMSDNPLFAANALNGATAMNISKNSQEQLTPELSSASTPPFPQETLSQGNSDGFGFQDTESGFWGLLPNNSSSASSSSLGMQQQLHPLLQTHFQSDNNAAPSSTHVFYNPRVNENPSPLGPDPDEFRFELNHEHNMNLWPDIKPGQVFLGF